MKRLSQCLAVTGIAAALLLSVGNTMAQDNPPGGGRGGRGGNFDPAQMQQRMLENIREQMDVKDDAEWKIIADRITKVNEARRDIGFGGGGMRRMFRPPGGDTQNADQGRRRFGPEPSAEETALEKAIDSKAPKAELKAAMTKFRAAKKEKEAKLEAAQEELLKVVDTKQEALLLSMGIVK